MNKKFLNAILFGALMASSTGTFVSCKDYDDDIKDLQEQINKKASVEDLKAQLSTVESSLAEAKATLATTKTTAETALATAQKAEADAKASGDAAAEAAAAAKKAAAEVELKAAEAKTAAIAAAEAKVNALKSEIESNVNASLEKIQGIAAKVDAVAAEAMKIIGHRLSSIALIPTQHVNGIAAITVKSLKYTPQVYAKQVAHKNIGEHATLPVLDHMAVANAKANYISSDNNIVKYHMNPSLGVRPEDINVPLFDCITSTNITRAVDGKLAGSNSPIMPVANQEININNGVLTVRFQRSPQALHTPLVEANSAAHSETSNKESFYMASLKVPVAESQWTAEEKAAGNAVYVNSEYNRIEEEILVPYLVNSKVDFKKAMTGAFADELQDGNYVHYHDSICLYQSGNEQYVDVQQAYNQALDLKTLVKVCAVAEGKEKDHTSHIDLADYANYGLAFRFELASAKYLQGTRQTDEQQFAVINNSVDGIMTSKVYGVGTDGNSRAAIGREPIVRVRLIDTRNNNALVAQRYIKVRWIEAKAPEQILATVTLPNDTVTCHDMFQQLFSQAVNEKIYHEVKVQLDGATSSNSISKTNFHNIYKEVKVVDLKKDGVSILKNVDITTDVDNNWDEKTPQVKDGQEAMKGNFAWTSEANAVKGKVIFGFLHDALDNTSYNLIWAMSPKAVGAIKDASKSKYEITVQYVDPTNVHGSITQTFVQDIIVPAQTFAYQATYWKNGVGEGTFNVNPIVYNTKNDGSATDAPHVAGEGGLTDYSHIEADLVNGYISTINKKTKPESLAEFIRYIRGCAEVKFVFDKSRFGEYKHLAGYDVTADQTQLWKKVAPLGTAVDTEKGYLNGRTDINDEGILDYVQGADQTLAATINNHLSATAATNKDIKFLPWNYDEVLNGVDADKCYSVIRLHEIDNLNGTDAAKELVGKAVPVKLVVKYNDFNTVAVQKFEVFFINPLEIDGAIGGNFVDAVINGSFLNVAEGFTFTDWNGYSVASKAVAKPTEKQQYAHDLYHYYGVQRVVFDTEKVTTSLKYNEATKSYEHTDGVKNGVMPYGSMLKQMLWDEATAKTTATETAENPSHLAYFNENGTPVNVDYKMYINVKVEYKWQTVDKNGLEINVAKAEGTPSNNK